MEYHRSYQANTSVGPLTRLSASPWHSGGWERNEYWEHVNVIGCCGVQVIKPRGVSGSPSQCVCLCFISAGNLECVDYTIIMSNFHSLTHAEWKLCPTWHRKTHTKPANLHKFHCAGRQMTDDSRGEFSCTGTVEHERHIRVISGPKTCFKLENYFPSLPLGKCSEVQIPSEVSRNVFKVYVWISAKRLTAEWWNMSGIQNYTPVSLKGQSTKITKILVSSPLIPCGT